MAITMKYGNPGIQIAAAYAAGQGRGRRKNMEEYQDSWEFKQQLQQRQQETQLKYRFANAQMQQDNYWKNQAFQQDESQFGQRMEQNQAQMDQRQGYYDQQNEQSKRYYDQRQQQHADDLLFGQGMTGAQWQTAVRNAQKDGNMFSPAQEASIRNIQSKIDAINSNKDLDARAKADALRQANSELHSIMPTTQVPKPGFDDTYGQNNKMSPDGLPYTMKDGQWVFDKDRYSAINTAETAKSTLATKQETLRNARASTIISMADKLYENKEMTYAEALKQAEERYGMLSGGQEPQQYGPQLPKREPLPNELPDPGLPDYGVSDFHSQNRVDDIPTVRDPSQVKGLAPGTRFRTPDGRVLEVPGGQQPTQQQDPVPGMRSQYTPSQQPQIDFDQPSQYQQMLNQNRSRYENKMAGRRAARQRPQQYQEEMISQFTGMMGEGGRNASQGKHKWSLSTERPKGRGNMFSPMEIEIWRRRENNIPLTDEMKRYLKHVKENSIELL